MSGCEAAQDEAQDYDDGCQFRDTRQQEGTKTSRDYVPSPQPRLAINLLPELSVGVDLLRRGDWVGEAPHTYFYVNWSTKAPRIL